MGAELDYKFAIGGTTTISLPTGKQIRLVELKVIPRRSEWRLITGTLWFDADTYGLVRLVFGRRGRSSSARYPRRTAKTSCPAGSTRRPR
ncbi:MAG: hypothetical protein R2909_08220 [Gemmatimonadales bacterium]